MIPAPRAATDPGTGPRPEVWADVWTDAATPPTGLAVPPALKPGVPAGAVIEQVGDTGFTGPLSMTAVEIAAAARGDKIAFAALYDRYSARLYDFALGMLRDRDAAADCVQDTFCIAATRLGQLREPDKIRPWLYSIVRHEALRRIKARGREQVVDEVPDHVSDDHGPDQIAARGELAALIADAAGGLTDRDRTVLELHYRHGLDGPELADALGISHTNANTLVGRLRTTIEKSLGALLVARHARRHPGHCAELDTVLDGWDGHLTVLMRKRIARHLEGCVPCQGQRAELVNPRALLGAAPAILPAPLWLRAHVLHHATTALPHAAGAAGAAGVAGAGVGGHAAAGHGSWWPASDHRYTRLRRFAARHVLSGAAGTAVIGAAAAVLLSGHPAVPAAQPAAVALPAPSTVIEHDTTTAAGRPVTRRATPGTPGTVTVSAPPDTVAGSPVTVTAPPATRTGTPVTVAAPPATRTVPGPVRTTTVTRTVCTSCDGPACKPAKCPKKPE